MLARLPKRYLAILIALWAAAAALVVALVLAGRDVALERAQRSTASYAAILAGEIAHAFQAVHLTLGAVADSYHLEGHPPRNDSAFQQMMLRRLRDLPFVRSIFLIGPGGGLIHDTNYPRTPDVSLADRAYFKLHQADPARDRAVSGPILSRTGTGWFLAATRRLGHAGTFEGVAVAAVQSGYFREQFQRIGLGGGDYIALFNHDAVLVARHPQGDEGIGTSYAHIPLFTTHLSESATGSYFARHSMVPGQRVVSYRVIEGTPLVIAVSRSNSAALSEWRRTAVGAAVAMSALTLMLAWFVIHVMREHSREERAREHREQAEKLEALGQLTGSIAHDFGNMLQVVSTNLAVLREHRADRPMKERAIAVAEQAVRRSSGLIEHLLHFSRRRPLNLARTDLNAAIAAAKPLLEHAAGSSAQVVVEPGAALPEVVCDAAQLEIALVNLVVNARDAMAQSGRIVLRTYLCDDEDGPEAGRARAGADFVCLAVEDSGSGMPESVRKRALEPFFTTKGDAGTGLGLSQVYGFMQQVDGGIRIDSAPGRGTTVHLFFAGAPAPAGGVA
ncbi:MAG TPA: ATP-binding protein [Burkholderiales bacterium]|nr:ATP-binding protein [Burkholderiales bacterium]